MKSQYRILFSLLAVMIVLWVSVSSAQAELFVADSEQRPSVASCLLYAVDQKGDSDAQLFTLNLRDKSLQVLGSLAGHDLEGIAIHPKTHILYATASEYGVPPSNLFTVDAQTGTMTLVGNTGFGDVADLTFRSTDATLWGWVEQQGLIQIDLSTGAGTLQFASPQKLDGITWNNEGALLYGANGNKLWVYDPSVGTLQQIADNLPKETTSLEMRPDGLLLGGVNQENSVDVFAYDLTALHMSMRMSIADSRYDPDDIAWPAVCGNASPGGEVNLITNVTLDKPQVCIGESLHVFVAAVHPESATNPVHIYINGKWGADQFLQFTGREGPRRIEVTAGTNEGHLDSRVFTTTVTLCNNPQSIPALTANANPYHDFTVDLKVVNSEVYSTSPPSYFWEFGDGQSTTTDVPFISHNYLEGLTGNNEYSVFHVKVTVRQTDRQDASATKSITIANLYAQNKRRGFIQPPVQQPSNQVQPVNGNLVGNFAIQNLEDEPLLFTTRQIEYQYCDPERDSTWLPVEQYTVEVGARQTAQQEWSLSVGAIPSDVCDVAVHLSGQTASQKATFASAYFAVKKNQAAMQPIVDPAVLTLLNQIADNGWVSNPDTITDEDLRRLAQEGKIVYPPISSSAQVNASTNLARASTTVPIALPLSGPGTELIGKECDTPGEISSVNTGIRCMPTRDFSENTQAIVANANKGDVLLAVSCGPIGALLHAVGQTHSHSGIMTKNRTQVTHSTAAEDRMQDERYLVGEFLGNRGTDGVRPDVLQVGWPGIVTQSIQNTFNGEIMLDPEGIPYTISGFSATSRMCAGDTEIVYPLVIKLPPGADPSLRQKQIAAADYALTLTGQGHYRFNVYTDAAIAYNSNYDAPPHTWPGVATATKPTVCSSLVWLAYKAIGLELEGPPAGGLEPWDKHGDLLANRDHLTLDGLYFYTEAQRRKAGNVLYQYMYNLAYEKSGWIGSVLTDAPDDVANQVANCFASDFCSTEAKDSDRWKNPGVGRAVSPDDMLFWDIWSNPAQNIYGYNERLVYRPAERLRIYRWAVSEGSGTLTGHVTLNGEPVGNATITIPDLSIIPGTDQVILYTNASGNFRLDGLPAGNYLVRAEKQIEDLHPLIEQVVNVTGGGTTNVELQLPDLRQYRRQAFVTGNMHIHNYNLFDSEDGDFPIAFVIDVNPDFRSSEITMRRSVEGNGPFNDPVDGELKLRVTLEDDNLTVSGGGAIQHYDDGVLEEKYELPAFSLGDGQSVRITEWSLGRVVIGGDPPDYAQVDFTVVNLQQPSPVTHNFVPETAMVLADSAKNIKATFPADALDATATIRLQTFHVPVQASSNTLSSYLLFRIDAYAGDGSVITNTLTPYELTIPYTDEEMQSMGIGASSLKLTIQKDTDWVALDSCDGCSVVIDEVNHQVIVKLTQFGEFLRIGEKRQQVYLPVIQR